jgi:hypothetical protein
MNKKTLKPILITALIALLVVAAVFRLKPDSSARKAILGS